MARRVNVPDGPRGGPPGESRPVGESVGSPDGGRGCFPLGRGRVAPDETALGWLHGRPAR